MFKCKPDLVTPELFDAENFSKRGTAAVQARGDVP